MNPILRRLGNGLRRTLSFVANSFTKLDGWAQSESRNFGQDLRSQRMCPFYRLITSRHKMCCLECGKSLKPA